MDDSSAAWYQKCSMSVRSDKLVGGILVITCSVYLLDIFSFQSNLSQKLFKSTPGRLNKYENSLAFASEFSYCAIIQRSSHSFPIKTLATRGARKGFILRHTHSRLANTLSASAHHHLALAAHFVRITCSVVIMFT